jgi:hypothetical protein
MLKFFLFDQLKRNLKQRFKHSKARFSVALMHVPGRTRLLLWSSNEARTLQGLGRRPSGQQAATRSSDRNPAGRVGDRGQAGSRAVRHRLNESRTGSPKLIFAWLLFTSAKVLMGFKYAMSLYP